MDIQFPTTELELINEHCPIFIFHSKEQVYPSSIEDIINKISKDYFNANAPIYYFHNEQEKYITYVLIYSKDEGIHNIGSHATDVEFVRVFYDELPKKYYLSQHSRDQGFYCHVNNLEYDNINKKNKIYIAKGTHANYYSKGVWVRVLGFANDITDNGLHWIPNNFIKLTDIDKFRELFGNGRMQWYADTKDIIGSPTSKINNLFYRFFYPLSKEIRIKLIKNCAVKY